MGTAGSLAIYFVLPKMGEIFDTAKIATAGGESRFAALSAAAASGDPTAAARLNEVLTVASQSSFRSVAILPAILLLVFGAMWVYDRSRGGYRPATIGARTGSEA
jgi:hypothetical protein